MSIPCPGMAGCLIAKMKLFLALAGVLATLILAPLCEGTGAGNIPLDSQGGGQWRGRCLGLGKPMAPLDSEPPPFEQPPLGQWRPRSFGAA